MTAPTPSASASGLVYADVPNRVIAFIIDAIVIAVIMVLVTIVLGMIGLAAGMFGSAGGSTLGSIIYAIVSVLIGAGYFIYTWTSMRATVGMRALGMQIGNAADGATLTQDQAIRRYLALAAPGIVGSALSGLPVIGALLGLVSLGWVIYLLYTTAQSPTKQGFHDVFAGTMVVKAAKSVG
jgi:uncharacterized RDD family membrane protein YckC